MAAPSQLVGQILGHYRILEQIGAGGMGVVYRAHDERLDRDVALKVLTPGALADEAARKRFRKEALALSRLNHPNIAMVFDFDTQDGMDFLVTEYIPGMTLDASVGPGFLPEKQVVRLGLQLAEGLAAAHEQGVVHRDLKPSNLRITPDGRLKILDFGIAKLLPAGEGAGTETLTEAQGVTGTLPYMSPEQLRGERPDARTDIYSAGAALYEMATGRRPFEAKLSTALTNDIIHRPPSSPRNLKPDLSPTLEYVILKCLEKEPENRYQSAKELAVDLRRLGTPSTTQVVPARVAADKRWVWALAIIGSVAVVTLLLVLLLLNVGWRERLLGRATPSRIESLAVLPLENLSGDPQQEYFADGMTEELTTKLAQISALRVISRTSVLRYRGARKPLPEIAKELHVDAVVEGSVIRMGERVRIAAELIEGSTDKHLWAKGYERDMRDVLRLQDEVAQAIANEIKVKLTPQEQVLLASARPVNPVALDAYVKSNLLNKGSYAQLRKARELLEEAIRIDPNYAPAYAGLADYYWSTPELDPTMAMPKAKQYALKALDLDPMMAHAHESLAVIQFYSEWDWAAAEQEFKRAIELSPSDAEAHRRYSFYLSALGRVNEALSEIRQSQQIDPLSISTQITAGYVFYFARQYDNSVEQCQKALELDPNSAGAHDCLGSSYLAKGMDTQAIAACHRAVELSGGDPARLVGLGRAFARAGRKSDARHVLEQLLRLSEHTYVPPSFLAALNVALGQHEAAFIWLDKAYEERDRYLAWLNVDRAFDQLRPDPRFRELLQRIGFSQTH